MKFALFEAEHGPLYKKLFEEDRKRLFPDNTFPPDKRDVVALRALDDICDYLPWYYQFGVLKTELEPKQAAVQLATPTMHRHAKLYGLQWVEDNEFGTPFWYLMPVRVEEVE